MRKWYPTPVFLLGESHGWRSLVGYSPWGHKESESTEHLSTQNTLIHFILFNVYLLIVNHMFSILMVTVGLAMKNTGIISTFKQHLQSKWEEGWSSDKDMRRSTFKDSDQCSKGIWFNENMWLQNLTHTEPAKCSLRIWNLRENLEKKISVLYGG